MGPRVVLQLNPKLETVYEKNTQPLINTSVDRRAEKGQAQAGRPRPGEPAWARPPGPQLLGFRPTQLKPTSSGNQERSRKGGANLEEIPGRPHFVMPRAHASHGN